MAGRGWIAAVPMLLAAAEARGVEPGAGATALRFEVTAAPGLMPAPEDGRLFVMLDPKGRREPRLRVGQPGLGMPPVLGRDVAGFGPGAVGVVDGSAAAFPIAGLARLPPGDYSVQAVFDRSKDLRSPNAPGNLIGTAKRIHLDPAEGGAVALELTGTIPPESPPGEAESVRFVTLRSEKLSAFHGRPISLRAGVILPRDFDREPTRRYPLRVHIGGFGSRYTEVLGMMTPGSEFHGAWTAADAPRMILLHLDGAGPLGDPYQIDSANHGPYGAAITQELIPAIERQFRGLGDGRSRVLDGGSTGGWVALALQVFYPDAFNGAWSSYPDPVDFRAFELIDVYADKNAYVNAQGFERPAAREPDGDVRYTMRHECRMENVLGRGDSWTRSGGQWGSWNAAYSPRGPDGLPVPLWDPATGRIDRAVAEHWKRYDLRLVLQAGWPTLGPKLRGKLRIAVGEADDYFLNNAVHRLDAFLAHADPPADATIVYGPGKGHGWERLSERQLLEEMAAAVGRR